MSSAGEFSYWLEPVSESAPCGEDLSLAPEFLQLDSLIRGKEETQFSEAVKPDWKQLFKRCSGLLERTRDLNVGVAIALAGLQTRGLAGAADGLGLIDGWLEAYWETLFPRLDPADGNDPLERMNILAALALPVGTYGDPFRFVERLGEAPLTNSPVLGRLGLAQLTGEADGIDLNQATAALRDTPVDELTTLAQNVESARHAVESIASRLASVPGGDSAPDFSPLLARLLEIAETLGPCLPVAAGEVPEPASGQPVQGQPAAAGAIASRSDVVRALDLLCAYYAAHEPSSPVPLLLQRAKRLVHADFLEILGDLAPEAVGPARSATGAREKE